ncbi:hypothetical protein [Amycolatopsis rubida]|uniref:Type IV secretion system protein n=1 Tax=Amycolatopsis rubida TaxID=112413 RepID=A0A1I5XG65_9PSEU|nr:hypothetical protein [Amycolatopsis rubida]SFQ30914.1 hypothetical protein SAMN05421854_110209 [Amycolatopsis rubida]
MPATIVLADDCGTLDVGCQIGSGVHNWFTDLANSIAKGAVELLAEAMTYWTKSDRSSMLQGPSITEIQGLLLYVGLVLLVGSVVWQGILMIWKRKAEPLVNTGMGLLSFAGWSTMGTAAAVLLYQGGLALSDQVLSASIQKFSNTMTNAMQANVAASTAAIFFLALIMFFLSGIQWILGFFRMGALVIILALIPTAAAGQINEATKPWLRKLLSWALSLILYQPIAAIVYAIGFLLLGEGTDIGTILTGMAVLAMAVIAMPTMLRFFDWGGQRFVSSGGGGGGAMAAGAAASMIGGAGASGFSKFMDRSGPAGDGGGNQGAGAPPVAPANNGDGPGGGAGDRPGGAPDTGHGGGPPGGGSGDAEHGPEAAAGTGTEAGTAGTGAETGTAGAGAAGAGAGAGAGVGAVAGAALEAGNAAKGAVSDTMTEGSGDE